MTPSLDHFYRMFIVPITYVVLAYFVALGLFYLVLYISAAMEMHRYLREVRAEKAIRKLNEVEDIEKKLRTNSDKRTLLRFSGNVKNAPAANSVEFGWIDPVPPVTISLWSKSSII